MRFRRPKTRAEVKMKGTEAEKMYWIIFNEGTDLEFAECSNCGEEMEPVHYRTEPADQAGVAKVTYPGYCWKCLCHAMGTMDAETGEIRPKK